MDRIERSRNPLSRLQVVRPVTDTKMLTMRQLDEQAHWATVGRCLTAVIVVGSGVYVLAAVLGWVS